MLHADGVKHNVYLYIFVCMLVYHEVSAVDAGILDRLSTQLSLVLHSKMTVSFFSYAIVKTQGMVDWLGLRPAKVLLS